MRFFIRGSSFHGMIYGLIWGTFIIVRDSYWPEVALARVQKVNEFILAGSSYWPEVALAKSGQNAADRVNS